MYKFAVLDPRGTPSGQKANEEVFIDPVFGIEVTVPELAARCVGGNLDPQHTGGDTSRAAIEDALTEPLPVKGTTLATIRPDLDSVGAMAILLMRRWDERSRDYDAPYPGEGAMLNALSSMLKRVRLIATTDKFARGGYTGPKPLPTKDNPWDESSATAAESSRQLAALAAAVTDFNVPLVDRVSTMERWLRTGNEPAQYRTQVEMERLDMITALETGQIKYETRAGARIAVVESTHRAATSVGYFLAPVVVAFNPSFKQGLGEPYKKFTICQFADGFADIKSALSELATLEAGWGGSPTIGGSPQGVSSRLTIDKVVEVVAKHLK
ncbi:MAG: hypothetical protein WC531_03745 [Candidatus Paceibacterota bacterium]|jgi:hypothetical protein